MSEPIAATLFCNLCEDWSVCETYHKGPYLCDKCGIELIISKLDFYTYILHYPDGIPYYVGKGHGCRFRHLGSAKFAKRVYRKIRDNGQKIGISLIRAENESEAFQREIELIKFYGRRDNGTGILCNLTDGGEGAVGQKGRLGIKHNDETRLQMSISASLRAPWSKERREAFSKKMKERWADEEFRARMIESAIIGWQGRV